VVAPVVEVEKVTEEAKANNVSADSLFARLVQLRRELAMEAGVPPYVIFNDKSLHEMAEKLPQDLAAFGNISGVGKAKLEKYGDIFLSAIKGAAA
jgi:ATP-dependent DNA helicase RecQ